jgi:hypothetical protein
VPPKKLPTVCCCFCLGTFLSFKAVEDTLGCSQKLNGGWLKGRKQILWQLCCHRR